jgi:AAA+ ATPase superfamily predicted ATPase
MSALAQDVAPATVADAENPWLGLAPFAEENRQFFYGRDEEIAELARRVQRKLLTVLFGQSGLGKTSILRAGLVPRLRGHGFCPVYVRLDYGRDAPEPAEQIKEAIARTARGSGEWTQVGVASAGESLWEFLHHRDDVLKDERGETLIPLLIFDQFEEIFTLAQVDEFGRARAARFVEELADLAENRPPRSLEAKLEADEAAAERFDFARGDYRVLIALREDYLAPLEGLKASMPSITQNRLRLAPMTGVQALAAVTGPGGRLVPREVAEAIVRFVAGGSELANAEVEPSLLSLICRELNEARRASGRPEISVDLLDTSRSSILENFYERALADQPAAVRRVIEDELLTESGFRENIAEESMLSKLAAAGAAPGTLPLLVNRRLLRIEERLDVRRVELTHDVLCPIVKASRDLRHERDARAATERTLAEQRAREEEARASLHRARRVATACIGLAAVALVAAGVAFVSMQRARRAEAVADEVRRAAQAARSQAEHLIGYLNDGFAVELEGFGRLDLLADLGGRQLAYYDALPASLQTDDTRASRAIAQVRLGVTRVAQGQLDDARRLLDPGVATLTALRAAGDRSERTAIGLALGLGALGDAEDRSGRSGLQRAIEAEAVLRPYFDAPGASPAVRRAYGLMANNLGSYQGASGGGYETLERAKRAFESLGALELKDAAAAADYAEAETYQGPALFYGNRTDELAKTEQHAVALAERVLEVRPGHLVAMRAQAAAYSWLSGVLAERGQMLEAARHHLKAADVRAALIRLDPTSSDSRDSYALILRLAADGLLSAGHDRESADVLLRAIRAQSDRQLTPLSAWRAYVWRLVYAEQLLDSGEPVAAERAFAAAEQARSALHERDPQNSLLRFAEFMTTRSAGVRAFLDGRLNDARKSLSDSEVAFAALNASNDNFRRAALDRHAEAIYLLTWVDLALGRDEDAAREAAQMDEAYPQDMASLPYVRAVVARAHIARAVALAHLGRTAEAAAVLAPGLAFAQRFVTSGTDHAGVRLDYAVALYARSLIDPARASADRAAARAALRTLPPEAAKRRSTQMWAHLIESGRFASE